MRENLIKNLESLTLFTQNAKKLAGFYRDKVGLKVKFEAVMGENDEEMYDMSVGKKSSLYVIDHSKVRGKNKQPERIIFNLEVDDIKKETARLKKAKVKVVQDTYHVEGYGYITTFADLDDNFFQLVQVKAN
ncbi:hypothetical protein A3J17_00540 [Candidatus Curtissbacteria bacterium RIFCSPLOWO2_02_FULL_40_11]|uniref:VOC domain-containing protein n=1 Tax=Candidatus Curtissbacteria bacterium RIFCSPHIGHO2_02_FULL_40_16b TaxID=1797714 RepID=A0A1F5G7W9_9BACT|nr:MAG: hypothetical protein A3D04_03315 [Candidatus Curtissbacteria bacterium RIFCSPHIGHO2_02_FULL_40_16b]OGE01546.1 MAG: hypothetical protein A3J17_00540 [Candidatus Curtissbacteria bacterium RIFCSPLOWO2_02_FULL_40_11]